MKHHKITYLICISLLLSIFTAYNFTIYKSKESKELSTKAILGQQLWQEKNCFNCHQLYGLGGYLGPDLTNIYSNPNKGPDYIKSMLNSGIKTMPKFNFTNEEKYTLLMFLKEVDKTGYYPDFNSDIEPNGWVEITNKNEK